MDLGHTRATSRPGVVATLAAQVYERPQPARPFITKGGFVRIEHRIEYDCNRYLERTLDGSFFDAEGNRLGGAFIPQLAQEDEIIAPYSIGEARLWAACDEVGVGAAAKRIPISLEKEKDVWFAFADHEIEAVANFIRLVTIYSTAPLGEYGIIASAFRVGPSHI